MEDNIDKALEFLEKLFDRLIHFAILTASITINIICIIGIISIDIIKDIVLKIVCIYMFIGLIPLVIDLLLIVILSLIECIIYGD